MQILVTNNHLDRIGGTETYTYYLIKELIQQGCDVEYYTIQQGEISQKIENELDVKFLSKNKYDLILANHNSTIEKVWKRGPVIQTCHGIFPYLEQPSLFADIYVAISEEVQHYLSKKQIASFIIPNGIDCNTFFPTSPINKKLTNVLSLCQSENANKKISAACNEIGIHFKSYHDFGRKVWNIQEEINKADLVVGLGRSIYDAMACGRTAVVYDERSYMSPAGDGYLAPNLWRSFSKNCSGRYLHKDFSVDELVLELKKYKPEDGDYNRQLAVSHFNIKKVAHQYIQLYFDQLKNWDQKKRMLIGTKLLSKKSKLLFKTLKKGII